MADQADRSPGPFGEGPRRRHELAMVIGADDVNALALALETIARELREDGTGPVVTGAPHWGGHWQHVVTPTQTQEAYFREVEAYLKRLKEERGG